MTILFAEMNDPAPVTCCICARSAGTTGIAIKKGEKTKVAWLCDDKDCRSQAEATMALKQKSLDHYEKTAITEAKAKIINSLFDALLGAIWENGPRDLNQMDDESFAKIIAFSKDSKDLEKTFENFLFEYSSSLRRQVAEGAPPF